MEQMGYRRVRTAAALLLGGGLTLATTSCDTEQLRSLLDSARALSDEIHDQDEITFQEWIASELDD